MKEILQHASVNHYAVPAPNCPGYNMVKAACMAAEAKKSAVIIDLSPRQFKTNATPEVWAPMVKAIAEPLDVPVALNLDHGTEIEDICRCIKAGFSSVMCDASSLPFEENVRRVQQVVVCAHAHGVSVEAELGRVGQAAEGDGRFDDMYTNVDMAVEFVKRTGCDCLAVAIGTAHGKYPADYVPRLDFERLAEIKAALGQNYPLVLHGGSGSGDKNFQKAVAGGINKINLWTDYSRTYISAVREFLAVNESPDYIFVATDAEEKASKWLERYMDLFGSAGRFQFSKHKMQEMD
ncbi:class II fructose-bisphosphate aldolase [Olsenella massiliensis]|uniref:class II fructose-bisphosphate aldolase n=1 Tax=Olsenella massiliensis TaxID=1622075 RepID=UPI001F2DF28A|nr:class II fructose-bisphosphate aldolase [Olsenella massiliensis]